MNRILLKAIQIKSPIPFKNIMPDEYSQKTNCDRYTLGELRTLFKLKHAQEPIIKNIPIPVNVKNIQSFIKVFNIKASQLGVPIIAYNISPLDDYAKEPKTDLERIPKPVMMQQQIALENKSYLQILSVPGRHLVLPRLEIASILMCMANKALPVTVYQTFDEGCIEKLEKKF